MAYSKMQSLRGSSEVAWAAPSCSFSTSFLFLRPRVKGPRSVALFFDSSTLSSLCSYSSPSEGDPGCLFGQRSVEKPISVDGLYRVVGKGASFVGVEMKRPLDGKVSKILSKRKGPLWRKMPLMSNKIKSIIWLNVITVIYASDISVVKEVETVMDPAAFAAIRFAVSAIPFLPFVFRVREDAKIRNAGLEALGLLTSDAGRASVISLFTVIVVPLLDGMLGAVVPAHTWLGVLISVIGVAMLECSGSPPNVGDLLNFLSAIFFGIHMLRTEHISRCTKKENLLALLGYEISVVAVLSTFWYLIGGWIDGVPDFDPSSWTLTDIWDWIIAFPWIPALYTGVISTGFCSWVEVAAMHEVTAIETAIIYGLEPVWGAAFAWFLLGERWGTMGWTGAALVLGGSLAVQILWSSPCDEEVENRKTNSGIRIPSAMDKQKLKNGPSVSPVIIRSRKGCE
ncbi:hypothetical protein SAY86_015294 [Trapa natans]|uniref:EamA domain-containing protein n=1 Tax=Trapa natans TaxID=22666 RepID=A0AAN7KHR4_TRANT|nr:hypothetical protein SAY86_015294 [Trapa natans]